MKNILKLVVVVSAFLGSAVHAKQCALDLSNSIQSQEMKNLVISAFLAKGYNRNNEGSKYTVSISTVPSNALLSCTMQMQIKNSSQEELALIQRKKAGVNAFNIACGSALTAVLHLVPECSDL